MIHLIPDVKSMQLTDGFLEKKAVFCPNPALDKRIRSAIEKLPCDAEGTRLDIHIRSHDGEAYTLDIYADKIEITAQGPAGAFYAIQTLRQLFQHEKIPCLHIQDSPDFSYRGFYHDVARGKVPTVETLKWLIDQMAYYKLNSLQLYVEHSFAFAEYADSVQKTGCLTAEEIRELDDYCADHFIEFVPSLACFGHLYELLQKPQYRHLQELESYEQETVFWHERCRHHTIDPLNPESFLLIKHMIDQFMPLFRSNKFNICCDETFDLKNGKHRHMDTGELYTNFVKQLIAYLNSCGKQVMMWGDVLLEHPERMDDLPKDLLLLNWDYDNDPVRSEKHIRQFAENKCTQIVCPGIWNWNQLSEKLSAFIPNITTVSKLAKQYGAMGILNTSWGDFGTPCSLDLSMFGITFGAAKSWTVETELEPFIESADMLVYRHKGAYQILDTLNKVEDVVKWMDLVFTYSNCLYKMYFPLELPDKASLLEAIKTCEGLYAQLQNEVWEIDAYRQEMLIAAEGLQVMAELLGNLLGYDIARKTDTMEWLAKYRDMWVTKNKPSEFHEIEKMFVYFELKILKGQTVPSKQVPM